MSLPPLTALRAFDVVARLRSVKNAARELGVTPAAVRLNLRTLEEHVGRRLVERRENRLALTTKGAEFHQHIERAFRELAAATAELHEGPRLRASVTPSIASRWLARRLSRFVAQSPRCALSLTTSMRVVDLAREDVDVAIRFGRGDWPGAVSRPLTASTLHVVASPELDVSQPLSEIPRIEVSSAPHDWPRWLEEAGRQAAPPVLTVDTVELALAAAEAALGLAVTRPLLAADAIAAGALVEPFATAADTDATYHLVHRPAPSALVTRFAAWIFDELSSR